MICEVGKIREGYEKIVKSSGSEEENKSKMQRSDYKKTHFIVLIVCHVLL